MKEVESISKWVEHRLIYVGGCKKRIYIFQRFIYQNRDRAFIKVGKDYFADKRILCNSPGWVCPVGVGSGNILHRQYDGLSFERLLYCLAHNGSPIRDAVRAGIRFQFINNKAIDARFIRQQKSKLGTINVASPELTAIDLVEHQSKVGGLNRVGTVLDELAENFDLSSMPDDFFAIYPVPVYQRLGYILDEVVDASEQADILYTRLTRLKKPMRATPLKTGKSTSDCELNRKWNVYVNHEIEIDEWYLK